MKQKGKLFWCELNDLLPPLEIPETTPPLHPVRNSHRVGMDIFGPHSEIILTGHFISHQFLPNPLTKKFKTLNNARQQPFDNELPRQGRCWKLS